MELGILEITISFLKILCGSIIKNINDNGFYGKPKERFKNFLKK
jgi:hypothetical protein